jgi:hypothetical protein
MTTLNDFPRLKDKWSINHVVLSKYINEVYTWYNDLCKTLGDIQIALMTDIAHHGADDQWTTDRQAKLELINELLGEEKKKEDDVIDKDKPKHLDQWLAGEVNE